MKQVTPLLAAAILLFATQGFATTTKSDTLTLSLLQAQEYAIQHSLTVKDASYDLEAAKKRVWESTAIGFPQANASLSYSYNPGSLPSIQFSPDSAAVPIGTKSSTNVTGTVSQLIFSGSYIVGLQAAKTYKQMVNQALQSTQVDVRVAVAQSYYLVLLTHQTSAVLARNRGNLQKMLDDTQKMFEKGFVEETAVDQLRLAVNEVELAIATTQRQEQVARRLLCYQLGMDVNAAVKLTDALDAIVQGINRERIVETPFDINHNISYQMVLTQEKVKKLLYRLEVASYLPTVSGFYQYQRYLKRQSFNFQPENMLGLSVQLPVFSSGQRLAKVGQAKIAYYKAQNAVESTSRALTLQYQQLRDDFNTAWEKYQNSKRSLVLAQKVFDDVSVKYANGMASSMDLTQANDKLQQAIATLYGVQFDLLNAKLQLDKVTSNI